VGFAHLSDSDCTFELRPPKEERDEKKENSHHSFLARIKGKKIVDKKVWEIDRG
jgi:hypothetical protein